MDSPAQRERPLERTIRSDICIRSGGIFRSRPGLRIHLLSMFRPIAARGPGLRSPLPPEHVLRAGIFHHRFAKIMIFKKKIIKS